MASEGDAGLTHLAGIEANSDGGISGFSFTGLSADYQHLAFRMRAAYDYEFWYPFAFRMNMGDGSIDTGSEYNRGISWGYSSSRFGFGDLSQGYASVFSIPSTTHSGAADEWTDGLLGVAEGTIWNYSDSAKSTAMTYHASAQSDGAVSTYNYWYWGWANYKPTNVVDQIQIQYPSINLKAGSRMDIWGWA